MIVTSKIQAVVKQLMFSPYISFGESNQYLGRI